MKTFSVRRGVRTRFIYLYDVIKSLVTHWGVLQGVLNVMRNHEEQEVPMMTTGMLKTANHLLRLLSPFRRGVSLMSGSNSITAGGSHLLLFSMFAATDVFEDDDDDVKSVKVAIREQMEMVSMGVYTMCLYLLSPHSVISSGMRCSTAVVIQQFIRI
jgi:hypothetical protein